MYDKTCGILSRTELLINHSTNNEERETKRIFIVHNA